MLIVEKIRAEPSPLKMTHDQVKEFPQKNVSFKIDYIKHTLIYNRYIMHCFHDLYHKNEGRF